MCFGSSLIDKFQDKSPRALIMMNTLLQVSKVIRFQEVPDLGPITSEGNIDHDVLKHIVASIPSVMKELRAKPITYK